MIKSVWQSFSDDTNFEPLEQDLTVDVAIIGGGITGITAAQLLAQNGLTVAVLEKDKVGMSSTGNSTGNLYCAVNEILLEIRKKFDGEVVRKIVESRREAIDLIEENVKRYKIDCDFFRERWNYFTSTASEESKITKAFEAAGEINFEAEYCEFDNLNYQVHKGFCLEGAAQFNPLRYVQGLAKAIASEKCLIFENTEVSGVKTKDEKNLLELRNEKTVTASYVIHATHTPKGIMFYHTELNPHREYGVAFKTRDNQFPPGVFYGHFGSGEIISTRCYKRENEQFIMVVGESHRVGHGDNQEHMDRLERFAREHFDVTEITHRWGAQNYKSADYIPYIGRARKGSSTFIATGLSSHGLTYGTVAAQIITDTIVGNRNQYAELYEPGRFNPVKSATEFIKDNVTVAKDMIKDYFIKDYEDEFMEVGAGEGKVIEQDGHKLAVYRDEEKELQICSAVCSHMGCIVRWNNAEKSWDCPCHGSRFDPSGEVIEGPAYRALASLKETRDGMPIIGSRNRKSPEPRIEQ